MMCILSIYSRVSSLTRRGIVKWLATSYINSGLNYFLYVKGVAQRDEPTQSYYLTLHFPSSPVSGFTARNFNVFVLSECSWMVTPDFAPSS